MDQVLKRVKNAVKPDAQGHIRLSGFSGKSRLEKFSPLYQISIPDLDDRKLFLSSGSAITDGT